MSIASEITRLQNAKAALKSSIEAKGVTVDESAKLDTYPDYIAQIPQGGGEYEPICFTSLEDGATFSFEMDIAISVDEKQTWQTLAANYYSPEVNTGGKIYFKAIENSAPVAGSTSSFYKFRTTKRCNVSGNPYSLYAKGSLYFFASLFNGTRVVDASGLILAEDMLSSYCYYQMFYNCTSLVAVPELPATSLHEHCYEKMFYGCTSLVNAPELPATTLASNCYSGMFQGCTSLVTAPELPVTVLDRECYSLMFSGCTGLTSAPVLPSTTLAIGCYSSMFSSCTSLVNAPELPATTLTMECYKYMFSGCTSLTTAPVLPATTLDSYCYQGMFYNCTSLVNAPELPVTDLKSNCYSAMFMGCTGLTSAPVLPATTLVSSCYYQMFYGCTSLVSAPELPATTLVGSCYHQMFYNCSSLNYIKALFTTTPSNSYTNNWVSGVAATGTFVKNSEATWTNTGNNAVPVDWTVETAS